MRLLVGGFDSGTHSDSAGIRVLNYGDARFTMVIRASDRRISIGVIIK